jgi:hypothetical protein
MSDPESANGREPALDGEQGPGVLGNLPRTRPSVRSPRRERQVAPNTETPQPAETAVASESEAADQSPADLEALARAGASIATGAATLGFRLAGRAASALRDAVERR